MGQFEVADWIKDNPNKWHSAKDIAKGLNNSIGSVTNNLKKIRGNNFGVKHAQKETSGRSKYVYKKE